MNKNRTQIEAFGKAINLNFFSHRHMADAKIDNKMGHHTWNEGRSAVERMFRLMALKFFQFSFLETLGLTSLTNFFCESSTRHI